MLFQFQVDGRASGPVRTDWSDAANDAVEAGYAVKIGDDQVRLADGGSIKRGYTDAELKN